jgi:N-formylmaleamate deformylase
VLALDVRGRGLTDRASDGYALPQYAADLAAVTHALELDRPVLLGHSMGARIVAAFAATNPGLARAVIAVDPPLSGPGRAPYPYPLEPYLGQIAEARAGRVTLEAL